MVATLFAQEAASATHVANIVTRNAWIIPAIPAILVVLIWAFYNFYAMSRTPKALSTPCV